MKILSILFLYKNNRKNGKIINMDYQTELNEKQYEAVSTSEQYVRIIAGAGSGKTRVLTYRIAYLIEKFHVYPSNILAITFTNKVAREMKERTENLLPDVNLFGLQISTFHSFCAKFLRKEIDFLQINPSFVIFDEEDQLRLLKLIGENKGYKKTDDIIKEVLDFIGKNKTKGLLPSKINIDELNEKEKKYFNFYVEYEKKKSECKALDFDDLLIYTITILSNFSEIKARYNEKFRHILIDEFQDTNDLQFQLLTLLLGNKTNLYVVGDPDQTIYTWRGANQDIILKMNRYFPTIKTIILDRNYRSTSEILNAANRLIDNNIDRVKKDLYTKNNGGKKIETKALNNAILEGNYVANKIFEIKYKNPEVKYSDFAILYRSSYLSLRIENALTARNIPYKVYGGMKFYSRKEVKDCLAYFKLLINEDDDVSFERVINVPRRKIGELTTKKIVAEANLNNVSMIKFLKNIHHYETSLNASIVSKLDDLFILMDETRAKITQNLEAYSEVLDDFITKIGYKDYLEENDDTKDKIENVRALIDDIRSFLKQNPESKFEDYLQNVSLLSYQDEIDDTDTVSLMTIHTAKGLEFDYVFVIGLIQNVFPNNRALLASSKSKLEEERRLAYVAFTRAKKELYLTLNRDYSYYTQSYNSPSQFIKEAGIDLETFSIKNLYNNNERLYKYDFDKTKSSESKNLSSNIINLNEKNKIKWNVGDIAIHKVFGEGKVIKVEEDFVVIDFIDYGKKTLLASHPTLSKKE